MTQPHDTITPDEAFGKISENKFRSMVVEAARERGYLVYFHDTNAPTYEVKNGKRRKLRSMGTPGFPDLTMVREGRLIFAELKVGKNKPTEYQRQWISELGEVGLRTPESIDVYVWYPSDWNRLIEALS